MDGAWHVTSGETAPDEVARLLGLLPTWFGIPESNAEYIARARKVPAYLAWPGAAAGGQRAATDGQPAGALLAVRHFPKAAEIYLMAVDPAWHRRGAGRALVQALETKLIADGVELLQVKTLGPSYPDAGYAKTRAFYTAMGFRPLEEIHGLWPGSPCLLLVKQLSGAEAGDRGRGGMADDHVDG